MKEKCPFETYSDGCPAQYIHPDITTRPKEYYPLEICEEMDCQRYEWLKQHGIKQEPKSTKKKIPN